jgi:diaminohydroxyphosphoribosylaminopyrimidine deaminase/5-amino-6-(5-phosphoribosylamino)uracil reductase
MNAVPPDPEWHAVLAAKAGAADVPPGRLGALFAALCRPPTAPDGCRVFAHIAQSLDGRIATRQGSSQWISGKPDIVHTHRMRALSHAIIVGAGTVRHDDPQLTVRECAGESPVRVVIDSNRRLGGHHRVFQGGPPTLLATCDDTEGGDRLGLAEILRLPRGPDGVAIPALLAALRERGMTHLFVEGGGHTIGKFLLAGCLDHLHVAVAPLLIGSGIPMLTLPELATIRQALRFRVAHHVLGDDMLFDCAIDRARPAA